VSEQQQFLNMADEGFGIETYRDIVNQESLNQIQAVLFAQTDQGLLRHSETSRSQFIRSLVALRFDTISFHAATLVTMTAGNIETLISILDPSRSASRAMIKKLTEEAPDIPKFIRHNSMGVELNPGGVQQDKTIKVSFNQLADSVPALDLLLECCDFQELTIQLTDGPHSYRSLQDRANWIGKQLLTYFEASVHRKYLNTKFTVITQFLSDKKNTQQPTVQDIDDAIIYSFWTTYALDTKLRFKMYRTVVEAWLDYVKALEPELVHTNIESITSTVDRLKGDPSLTTLFNTVFVQHPIFSKLLPSQEMKTLMDILMVHPSKHHLWLTTVRLLAVSPYQNKLLEYRRKNKTLDELPDVDIPRDAFLQVEKGIKALVQVEASTCTLALFLDTKSALPHALALHTVAQEHLKQQGPTVKTLPTDWIDEVSQVAEKIQSTRQTAVDQNELSNRLKILVTAGKKFRRGAFADFETLKLRCIEEQLVVDVLNTLDYLWQVREEVHSVQKFVTDNTQTLLRQLAEDLNICRQIAV